MLFKSAVAGSFRPSAWSPLGGRWYGRGRDAALCGVCVVLCVFGLAALLSLRCVSRCASSRALSCSQAARSAAIFSRASARIGAILSRAGRQPPSMRPIRPRYVRPVSSSPALYLFSPHEKTRLCRPFCGDTTSSETPIRASCLWRSAAFHFAISCGVCTSKKRESAPWRYRCSLQVPRLSARSSAARSWRGRMAGGSLVLISTTRRRCIVRPSGVVWSSVGASLAIRYRAPGSSVHPCVCAIRARLRWASRLYHLPPSDNTRPVRALTRQATTWAWT